MIESNLNVPRFRALERVCDTSRSSMEILRNSRISLCASERRELVSLKDIIRTENRDKFKLEAYELINPAAERLINGDDYVIEKVLIV